MPITRMLPRALMIPPGIPDFPLRARTSGPGRVTSSRAAHGRAPAPVEAVEVSVDGGASWERAPLERDVDSAWAWVRWSHPWDAAPGVHELALPRAGRRGDAQPLEPRWNVGGYANNAAQRVRVTVAS